MPQNKKKDVLKKALTEVPQLGVGESFILVDDGAGGEEAGG